MTREIEIKGLDITWMREFLLKLTEAGGMLEFITSLLEVTSQLVTFDRLLKECGKVQADTTAHFALKVAVSVDKGACELGSADEIGCTTDNENEHKLDVSWAVPVTTILRMLHPLIVDLFTTCKAVEEDSSKLQDVLGAVSAFRDMGEARFRMTKNGPELIVNEPDPVN